MYKPKYWEAEDAQTLVLKMRRSALSAPRVDDTEGETAIMLSDLAPHPVEEMRHAEFTPRAFEEGVDLPKEVALADLWDNMNMVEGILDGPYVDADGVVQWAVGYPGAATRRDGPGARYRHGPE